MPLNYMSNCFGVWLIPKNHLWLLPTEVLLLFNSQFQDETSLMEAQGVSTLLISPSLVHFHTSTSITDHSHIASQLQQIKEHIIDYIQSSLARFGFVVWCPNLCQTPYTLYNAACQIVALLNTFKQALVLHTYAHLAPNLLCIKNIVLLVKMYDHFIYHYLYNQYKKECYIRACNKASPEYYHQNTVYANSSTMLPKLIDLLS